MKELEFIKVNRHTPFQTAVNQSWDPVPGLSGSKQSWVVFLSAPWNLLVLFQAIAKAV